WNGTANRPFRTRANQPVNWPTDDLGTLGGTNINGINVAYGINASGQAVGQAVYSGSLVAVRAFRTAPNQPIKPTTDDLGTLGGTVSYPYAINNAGDVVGYSDIPGDSIKHAFVFTGSSMLDLNNLVDASGQGWVLTVATGINNKGQIVGSGT